ncbi:signal peptidase I [Lysobacter korlensis]|uniref:Signal peptidase I n=1 Tax=Lysobacter korlensis TaxID=553636 RepID=A0ABV6RZ84_9GAMM
MTRGGRDAHSAGSRRTEVQVWPSVRRGIVLGMALLLGGIAALIGVVPAATGATALTVLTGSMAPALPAGSVVVVRPAVAEEVRVGDVITYHPRPGEPAVVTHRVLGVISGSDGRVAFLTKGDANAAADPVPVVEEQVAGVAWYSVPFVGTLRVALDPHLAWLRPVLGAALVIAGALLMARRRLSRTTVRVQPTG